MTPDHIRVPYHWEPVVALPDGHRMFASADDPFKWVAIADNSGVTPEETDDGVLWLDFNRPLMVGSLFTIPLKADPSGNESRTISDMSTLLYLSSVFNWAIVDQRNNNEVYRVKGES